jgi:hypothetical protein
MYQFWQHRSTGVKIRESANLSKHDGGDYWLLYLEMQLSAPVFGTNRTSDHQTWITASTSTSSLHFYMREAKFRKCTKLSQHLYWSTKFEWCTRRSCICKDTFLRYVEFGHHLFLLKVIPSDSTSKMQRSNIAFSKNTKLKINILVLMRKLILGWPTACLSGVRSPEWRKFVREVGWAGSRSRQQNRPLTRESPDGPNALL